MAMGAAGDPTKFRRIVTHKNSSDLDMHMGRGARKLYCIR